MNRIARPVALGFLILCAAVSPALAQPGDPIAMAENPSGMATLRPAGGGPAKPLQHGDALMAKDRLQLAPNGRVTLIFVASLQKKEIPGGVDSQIDALGTDVPQVSAAAPGAPRLSSLVAVLSAPQLEAEGGSRVPLARTVRSRRRGYVELVYPKNTRIREERPVFQWREVAGADGYEISLLTGTLEPVVDREIVHGTSYAYPLTVPPPEPGRPYFWQVRARGAGRRPGALVYFERIAGAEAARVDRETAAARSAIRAGGVSEGTEALLVGSRLDAAGLAGDALATMKAGLARDPSHAALTRAIAVLEARSGRAPAAIK